MERCRCLGTASSALVISTDSLTVDGHPLRNFSYPASAIQRRIEHICGVHTPDQNFEAACRQIIPSFDIFSQPWRAGVRVAMTAT